MIYSKIKFISFILLLVMLAGCSSPKRYDYSIHKPKVRFKPSLKALDRLRYETIGHPYVWGAENDGCYDCSGLTYYIFGSMGIEIPRVANDQFHSGIPVAKSDLKKGDLVFFATSRRRPGVATHVGIYLGNGKFQHASSAKGRVIISSLNSPYWQRTYLGARRYYNFNNYFKPRYPSNVLRYYGNNGQDLPQQNPIVQKFSTKNDNSSNEVNIF